MRTRATYGLLIAAALVGASVIWWPRDDEPVSVVDTIDLTAENDSDEVGGIETLEASGAAETEPYDLVELRSAPGVVELRVHRFDHFDGPCGYASVRVGVSTELAVGIVEVRVPDGSDVRHLQSQIVGGPEDDYTVVIVGRGRRRSPLGSLIWRSSIGSRRSMVWWPWPCTPVRSRPVR